MNCLDRRHFRLHLCCQSHSQIVPTVRSVGAFGLQIIGDAYICYLRRNYDIDIQYLSTAVGLTHHVRWVPVTTAWRVLRLRMEERPPIWRVAANILNTEGRVTGEWRKLHNEELSHLYSLPNIVRVVKSRRMRRAGHVARMGEGRGVHRVLVGKREG